MTDDPKKQEAIRNVILDKEGAYEHFVDNYNYTRQGEFLCLCVAEMWRMIEERLKEKNL